MDPSDGPLSFFSGNPANHPRISHYLKSIREEQAQARVTPKQAVPLFFDKFLALASHIKASLLQPGISPTSCFIYARDLAFFCLDFFSGDRASDLGRLKTHDVLSLPDNQGLLFRHTFGKTLRGKHTHTFAVKPFPSPSCPIANLKLYILLCDHMHVNLRHGFLFRSTDKQGRVTDQPFVGSAVTNRLKKYLSELQLEEGETAHSFRTGCSITLSLLGASLEDVAKHVGWRSLSTAAYYTQTEAVMNPASTSSVLANGVTTDSPKHPPSTHQLGALFRSRNNLEGFSLAFP